MNSRKRPLESRSTRRPTALDVARAAKVSTATVSLIVSGKDLGRVSESTKKRVIETIQQLNYRVDTSARSLATGVSPWISLVVGNLNNPFFSAITMGAYEAFDSDFQLLLTISDPRSLDDPIQNINSLPNQIEGTLTEAWALPHVLNSKLSSNVVALDWQEPKFPAVSTVGFNLEQGVFELAHHLISLTHNKFVYVDADISNPSFDKRRILLKELLQQLSNGKAQFLRERCHISLQESAKLFEKRHKVWLQQGITSIICATDIQALGMVGESPRLGLDIPGDFSISGFDDLPLSSVGSPKLTTVRLSGRDLGFEAANLIKKIIRVPSRADEHIKLESRLIVRESTGEPR